MGWGNCGADSKGRPIGYVFKAPCDFPGCDVRIDRGLSYVCGHMHGEDEISCEGYFCGMHKSNGIIWEGVFCTICDACATFLINDGAFELDDNDNLLKAAG